MTPMLVDLLMLRIVLDWLLDFDMHRADVLDVDPYRYLIEEELAEEFEVLAGDGDPATHLRRHAIARALDLLERFDPDDPDMPSGPGAANDD